MIRRQARLRREYIYRKSLEEKQKVIQEKRERVKRAIDGETWRRDLSNYSKYNFFSRQSSNPDRFTQGGDRFATRLAMDWRWCGSDRWWVSMGGNERSETHYYDIARSEFATQSIRKGMAFYLWDDWICPYIFQEMKLIFPNSQRMNRGHYDIKKLVQACRANEVGVRDRVYRYIYLGDRFHSHSRISRQSRRTRRVSSTARTDRLL